MYMYLPTSIIGTLGQYALSSGCHLLATFSKELRALMEKQIKKQSVCKREELQEYTWINTFEERTFWEYQIYQKTNLLEWKTLKTLELSRTFGYDNGLSRS